jgi:hypothetical protein
MCVSDGNSEEPISMASGDARFVFGTRAHPTVRLYRHSGGQALAARAPFDDPDIHNFVPWGSDRFTASGREDGSAGASALGKWPAACPAPSTRCT